MKHLAPFAIAAALLLTPSLTHAAPITYNVNMTGAKEVTAAGVPNQGDPDALVTGTLTLDNGTGSGATGSASFNLVISNLDFPVTGYHIHTGGPNTTGSILLNFQNFTPFENIRTGNTFVGTVSGLDAANVTAVEANPAGFYFNIHNGAFPGGAVRDQVPEPAALAPLALAGLLLRRRRRNATPASERH
jgi:MYXO-CTERM domain-containing protein